MTFSQLLVLLEAQELLSCDKRDRDIQTQTSAEHTNQTEDSGRNCLIWNSLQASFPFGGVIPQGCMRGFATCSCVLSRLTSGLIKIGELARRQDLGRS